MLTVAIQNPENLDDPTDLINVRENGNAVAVYFAAMERRNVIADACRPKAFTTRHGFATVSIDIAALPDKARREFDALRRISQGAYPYMPEADRKRAAYEQADANRARFDRWIALGYDLDAMKAEALDRRALEG